MPNRILRDGILSSEAVAALGWAEEVLYRRLMSVADDFGRFHAHPALIRAACYPLQLEKVSDADIVKWTRCAEKAGLVSVYPAQDGKRYIQIVKFGQQVRATKSKFPDPIATASKCEQPPAPAHVDVAVVVSASEVEQGAPPAAPPPAAADEKATRLPKDWAIPPNWLEWAKAERPELDCKLEAAKFADYWHAKAGKDARKADWLATWRNWIRNANAPNGKFQQPAPTTNPGGTSPKLDPVTAKAREADALREMNRQLKELGHAA